LILAGVELEPGWPCNGPLLRLAEDAATRLLPAFDTPTGMPYGTVNLRHGVPAGETPVTCTAGVGTFVIEFGKISPNKSGEMLEARVELVAFIVK
jgi:mannosidase alpha-like ER degradation enhancer 2